MHAILTWIMNLMQAHGPLSVFVGVIIESIIVPIPSPLIIMGAGAVLITPGIPWFQALADITFKIVVPGAVASTIGAYFTYGLAYWGGKPLIDRMQGFLGFSWSDVLMLEKRLFSRAVLMIIVLRALPIVPLSLVSAAAGALRVRPAPFTWATLAGSIPRCMFLAWLGYLTRDSYVGLAKRVDRMESIVSAGIVILAIVIVLTLRHRMTKTAV